MPVFKNYIKTNFELDFKLFFWNIVESEKELSLGLKFNSVFKAFKVNGIKFSEQIVIDPFNENSSEGIARIFYNDETFKFHLFFFKINNYSATVVLSLY
jgi:hypothetical protein